MAENNPKLTTIRNLLALAEGASTEQERDLAMERAGALMEKYSIDEAMIESSKSAAERRDKITSVRFPFEGGEIYARQELLSRIAYAHDVRVIVNMCRRAVIGLTLFGWESDLRIVELLYTSLLLQHARALKRAIISDQPGWLRRGEVTVWRRTWTRGFAERVGDRLRVARNRAAEQYDTAARERVDATRAASAVLVVVDRRQAVIAAFDEKHGGLRKRRSQGRTDLRGYDAGVKAGNRADIGSAVIGGQRRQIT